MNMYESLFHSQTQVVENGEITKAGYILEFKNSVYGSALASLSMAIFWLLSVFKKKTSKNN